jgi:hypothetical protein
MTSRATRARTGVLGNFALRSAALPPATGVSEDLFTVDSGPVVLLGFYGYVSVAIPNVSLDFDLALDPDDGGSDSVLASLLAVDNTAVGTFLTLNTTAGSALVAEVDVAYKARLATPIVLDVGDIKLNVAGGGAVGTTARVSWGAFWVPLTDAATLVAV